MDKPRHNRQPGAPPAQWRGLRPGLADGVEPDPQSMARIEQQFLRGVAKARRRMRPGRTMALSLRWALGGALLFALVMLGPILAPDSTSLVAAPFPGMQGQVLSAVDQSAVSGVEVWLKDGQPWYGTLLQRDPGKLVAITNAHGFFDLPAGQLNGSRQVILKHAGRTVAQFNQAPGGPDFKYQHRIWIQGSGAQPEDSFDVNVSPGQTQQTAAGVAISLDRTLSEPWQGKLVRSQRWPAAFSYGCILDGVYSLEGEPAAGLEIKVRLDAAALAVYHAKPEDVVLLAHNDDYGQQDGGRGFHRGWYRATQSPNPANLPAVVTKLTYDKPDKAYLSWPAKPGVRYSLQVPMHVEGKLDFVNFYADGTNTSNPPELRLMLLDQNRPQLYTVFAYNRPPGSTEFIKINSQPRVHQPFYELINAPDYIKFDDDGRLMPLGRWRIELLDFTLQESHTFEIDAPAALPKPGSFRLELAPGQVGGMSTARVTGDLERLAQPPAWSYGFDYTDQQYGASVELPAPYPSSYKVQVTLRETNGAVTVLCGTIDVTEPSLPLYFNGSSNSTPVLDCTQVAPDQSTSVQAMTATALANPLPYGYCVSDVAGPVWRCCLPDELTGTPIKTVRVVQYASPLAGDVSDVELQPVLCYAPREQRGTRVAGIGEWMRPDGRRADLCNDGLSHIVKYAVRFGEMKLDLHEFLSAGYHYKNHVAPNVGTIREQLGWDLNNLPSNEKLLADAKAFKASNAYGRRLVTQPRQQLIWEFDLEGIEVPPGEDLMLRYSIETGGLLLAAQWNLESSYEAPSYIEVEVEGQTKPWRGYFDYRPLHTQ